VAGIGWVAALWYLRVTAHPAVLSWERLARLRGLAEQKPLGDRLGGRLGTRIPLLRSLQGEADRFRALLFAEPQVLISWAAGDNRPQISGDTSLLMPQDSAQHSSQRILAFGSWLPPEPELGVRTTAQLPV